MPTASDLTTTSFAWTDSGLILVLGLMIAYAAVVFVLMHWYFARKAERAQSRAMPTVTTDDLQKLRFEMGTWTELLSRTAKQARKSSIEREHMRLRLDGLEDEVKRLRSVQRPAPAKAPIAGETIVENRLHLFDPAQFDPAERLASAEVTEESIDDLTQIRGIGPVNQTLLNENGIHSFKQIAAWDESTVESFNGLLGFKGRIQREQWVAQAKSLLRASGNENAA